MPPSGSTLELRPDEIGPALVAALFFFCVLTALMVLRPARDALGMEHSIDSLRGLVVITALATLAVNPLFGWLIGRLSRPRLIGTTYGFVALSLMGFWGLMRFAPGEIGLASGQVFYVWFNVFNLFVILVFWELLSERFTREQGERLFALISIGGTSGAIFGPWLTTRLAAPLGTANLLPVAAGFLLLGLLAARRLLRITPKPANDNRIVRALHAKPLTGGGAWAGIRSVFASRYLSAIACYVMLMSASASFLYFAKLQRVAAIADAIDARAAMLGHLEMWTHVAVLVLQLALSGRLIRRFGLGIALAILPIATTIGFAGLAIYGSVAMLMLVEAVSRAVQRGITQPAREALFAVVPGDDQYKAKAFIDTLVYRSGDVVGAQTEGMIGAATGSLIGVALPLALAWTALAWWLGRRPSPEIDTAAAAPGFPGSRCNRTTPEAL